MELNHGYPLFNDVIDEPTFIEGMEEQLHTTERYYLLRNLIWICH